MATGRGNVGYRRVIIIAVIGTAVAILIDHYGLVDRLARMIP